MLDLIARELRHDVRNQLFALRTAFAALSQNPHMTDRAERSLRLCAGSLERLTSSMQEYFALQTGEKTDVEENLEKLVTEVVDGLKSAADALGLKFNLQLAPIKLSGRGPLLAMAIRRIVSAVMGMAAGEIAIRLHSDNVKVQIDTTYAARKDVPKQAVEESISSLALAEEVVTLHGGQLKLEPGHLLAWFPRNR
jgi:signal transduction histidine kinase